MKNVILSALVALMVLAAPALADVAVGEVGASASPGDQPPTICVYSRYVTIGEAAGVGINPENYRTGLYAFTGEQIHYIVVVRDPNGALDIGFVKALVGGQEEVLANPYGETIESCDGLGNFIWEIS
jgi:hypothetical protein